MQLVKAVWATAFRILGASGSRRASCAAHTLLVLARRLDRSEHVVAAGRRVLLVVRRHAIIALHLDLKHLLLELVLMLLQMLLMLMLWVLLGSRGRCRLLAEFGLLVGALRSVAFGIRPYSIAT